ncbi:hypothetical protein [Prevotella histicola]|uniref:hypothetical protein n=1 Tax=Prevotella histicola TaxID=470565 RepID=UPI003C70EB19
MIGKDDIVLFDLIETNTKLKTLMSFLFPFQLFRSPLEFPVGLAVPHPAIELAISLELTVTLNPADKNIKNRASSLL